MKTPSHRAAPAEQRQPPAPWKPRQREALWVIGTMAVIVGALILTPVIVRMLATFEYQGLTFTRERFGDIPVYHYSYYFTDDVGQQYQYNLYLRNDPRTNTVPIDNTIAFEERRTVYVTLNSTALSQCSTSLRDVAALAQFLNDNLIPIQAGNIDPALAQENNLTHVTCETHPTNVVVAILPGNETRVSQHNLCHRVTYDSCEEVLPALEKFMVEALRDAKAAR